MIRDMCLTLGNVLVLVHHHIVPIIYAEILLIINKFFVKYL